MQTQCPSKHCLVVNGKVKCIVFADKFFAVCGEKECCAGGAFGVTEEEAIEKWKYANRYIEELYVLRKEKAFNEKSQNEHKQDHSED